MKFRPAQQSDFDILFSAYREIVVNLEKRDFDEAYYRRALEKAICDERNLVVEVNGKLAGFVEYNPVPPDLPLLRDRAAWIDWIWVHPEFRRRGVGNALYKEAFRILKRKGFKFVGTDAFTVNPESQKFHEDVGFKEKMRIYVKRL